MSLKDRIKGRVTAMDAAVRPWAQRSRLRAGLYEFLLFGIVHPPQAPGEGQATNPLTNP